MDDLSHCVTVACAASAETAYAFLADPTRIGTWALGCWAAHVVDSATVSGTSLFDDSESVVRVEGHLDALSVDYYVGSRASALTPRIMARVVPGPVVSRDVDECLVSLIAWRVADMDEERWHRLVASHESEILILRARIEAST